MTNGKIPENENKISISHALFAKVDVNDNSVVVSVFLSMYLYERHL